MLPDLVLYLFVLKNLEVIVELRECGEGKERADNFNVVVLDRMFKELSIIY